MSDNFRARDIALKAQKKILSKMSTKSVAKVFIDDRMGSLLDNVYRLIKTYVSNKSKENWKHMQQYIYILWNHPFIDSKQKGSWENCQKHNQGIMCTIQTAVF